jgi:hypothetical protein
MPRLLLLQALCCGVALLLPLISCCQPLPLWNLLHVCSSTSSILLRLCLLLLLLLLQEAVAVCSLRVLHAVASGCSRRGSCWCCCWRHSPVTGSLCTALLLLLLPLRLLLLFQLWRTGTHKTKSSCLSLQARLGSIAAGSSSRSRSSSSSWRLRLVRFSICSRRCSHRASCRLVAIWCLQLLIAWRCTLLLLLLRLQTITIRRSSCCTLSILLLL